MVGSPNQLSRQEAAQLRDQTFTLYIKGYNGATIHKTINNERQQKGLRPVNKATVHKWVRDLNREGSKHYLSLLKDKTAYMVLHRSKLLALQLYRTMLHDKIEAMGGISSIKAETLNRMVQTLTQITVTESRLEREIPSLFTSSQETLNPDQVNDLEQEILADLPKDLREQFMKNQTRRQRQIEQIIGEKGKVTESDLIDLDQYPKDTYVI